jgi:hypothetical protein
MSQWYNLGYLPENLKLSSSPTSESYPVAAIIGDSAESRSAEYAESMFDTNITSSQVRQLRESLKELIKML